MGGEKRNEDNFLKKGRKEEGRKEGKTRDEEDVGALQKGES